MKSRSVKQKKKVLLVNPGSLSKNSILVNIEAIVPPIGLLYIAAILGEKNIVEILDENITSQSLLDFIKNFKPDYIGISVNYSIQFPRAIKLAQTIKKYDKNIIITIGGIHITSIKSDIILKENLFIDFLIKGDGEYAMSELVSGRNFSKIIGLSYRIGKKIQQNGTAYIKNLDRLPFPARHLINSKKYRVHPFEYSDHRNMSIITSRGCVSNCIYCVGAQEKYRVRSAENVIYEMKLLYKSGIRDLTIYDACFTLDMERAEKICDLIIKEKLNFSWCCETRADRVNEKLLIKMKKAGCTNIFYGIETGSIKVMKKLKKNINLFQVKKAINLTKAVKIRVYAGFMIGYPFETREDLNKTIKLSKKLDIDVAWFSIVTPFPGTELWEMSNHNINDPKILEKLSIFSGEIAFWDRDIIEKYLHYAIRSFYFRFKIILGLLIDLLTRGTLKRKLHLLKLLLFQNPFLKGKRSRK